MSTVKPVIEGLPSTLLRAWDQQQFYESFLRAGNLRLRRLPFYKNLEDKQRADADEGLGRLKVPGMVRHVEIDPKTLRPVGTRNEPGHFHWEMGITNPVYILCLSCPTVDLTHLRKFGPYIVEISAPQKFCDRVNACLLGLSLPQDRIVASIEWFHVRYDKGELLPEPDDPVWRLRIAYGQKHESYRPDCEYRCAVTLSNGRPGAPEYLDISLGDVSGFARPYR